MQQTGHNGLLIKTALFPLENDKLSWDLSWIQRAESLVEQMQDRGIYAQVNFFDTWSRDADEWFQWNTTGSQQTFNVWTSSDEGAKENYIRTLVARFAGYSNVYWELGNEMEHSPNSGSSFISEANSKYIPWIRQYDPYGLPIGVSEGTISGGTNVDINFLHQTGSLPPSSGSRVYTMNELVSGWGGGSLWKDDVIRNPDNRFGYRRTFWRMFTYGGSGSTEATWLDISTPLNSAVLTVMNDQHRLRDFVESLQTNINQMNTDTSFVLSGPGQYRTRSKPGEAYATYFMLNPGQSTGSGNVTVSLAPGEYQVNWVDPKTGTTVSQSQIAASGNTLLPYYGFTEDIALSIVTLTPQEPIDPVFGTVDRTDGQTGDRFPIGPFGGETDPLPSTGYGIQWGATAFSDRDYTFDLVDAPLVGADWVRTFNTDKSDSENDVNYQVTLLEDALMMVLMDDRRAPDPQSAVDQVVAGFATAGQFTDTGWDVSLNETSEDYDFSAFGAMLSAGTYDFGPSPDASHSFYMLAAIAFADGDFNVDFVVDGADLDIWRTGFGTQAGATRGLGDADGDADVDGNDFLIWQRNLTGFEAGLSAGSAVPEPTSILLITAALFSMAFVRE